MTSVRAVGQCWLGCPLACLRCRSSLVPSGQDGRLSCAFAGEASLRPCRERACIVHQARTKHPITRSLARTPDRPVGRLTAYQPHTKTKAKSTLSLLIEPNSPQFQAGQQDWPIWTTAAPASAGSFPSLAPPTLLASRAHTPTIRRWSSVHPALRIEAAALLNLSAHASELDSVQTSPPLIRCPCWTDG